MASIFDSAQFSRTLFFPRRDRSEAPSGAVDRSVAVEGASLHLRVHAAVGEGRVSALLFHGNGEVVADYDGLASNFASIGLRLCVSDYRGYGQSSGTPSLRAMLDDAPAVLSAAREVVGDGALVLMGRSLGSLCAQRIASQNGDGVSSLVLDSGIADLAAFMRRRGVAHDGPLPEHDLADFDPMRRLRAITVPTLVIHGERDTLIDPSEARAAHEALGSERKRLAIVPGRRHNDLFYSEVYWAALRSALPQFSRDW